MLRRWFVTCGFVLLVAGVGRAQAPQTPPLPVVPDTKPTELPPLLVPPTGDPNARPPMGPSGPSGEYDHNLLYLPQAVPVEEKRIPEPCGPSGKWWVDTSVALAATPRSAAPGAVRTRVPDGMGGTMPGPILPVGNRTVGRFRTGLALTVGRFIGEDHKNGIEASLFTLGQAFRTLDTFAPGMLVLFPGGTNRSAPQVITLPAPLNSYFGTIFPTTLTSWFIGSDVNYRHTVHCGPSARLDALAGYRFAYLQEELYFGDFPDGGHNDYKRNRVVTANAFHGGQVGLAGEYRADRWYVSGSAKVAFGVVTPEACATGYFTGAEGATGAGFSRLAALSGNRETQFAVLPTVNLTIGKQIREHTRIFAGYSFQYLNRVARLGDALNPGSPGLTLTDFWISSLNLGLELRY